MGGGGCHSIANQLPSYSTSIELKAVIGLMLSVSVGVIALEKITAPQRQLDHALK